MLLSEPAGTIAATATIPQDIAWRIFTKGIARDDARAHVRVTGDTALGSHVVKHARTSSGERFTAPLDVGRCAGSSSSAR